MLRAHRLELVEATASVTASQPWACLQEPPWKMQFLIPEEFIRLFFFFIFQSHLTHVILVSGVQHSDETFM